MTADINSNIRASRIRVSRSRGAASGALLVVLGAWAALVPLIGPSFNLGFTPAPDDSWKWTAARAWLEVVPGGAALLGGLLLLISTNRLSASLGGWLAAAGGAWLIVGPPLADVLNIELGVPDPTASTGVRAAAQLLYFFGAGAAILFLASIALGRLSVHSVRDVRAAEHRATAARAAEHRAMVAAQEREAAEQERHAAEQERRAAEQDRYSADRDADNDHVAHAYTRTSEPVPPPPHQQQQ